MDIDSPPLQHDPISSHPHLSLPPFSASFPLPFRVLFLIGLAQLLWATNLHLLHYLNIDPAWVLDIHPPDTPTSDHVELSALGLPPETPPHRHLEENAIGGPVALHGPVYRLFLVYVTWVGAGWFAFWWVTGGDVDVMEQWRGLLGVIALGAILGAILPWQGPGQRERRALRRCVFLRARGTG